MEKENFSKRLQIALDNKNWSQADLEKAVSNYKPKIDKTLINKYLKGLALARQQRLSILADVLGVTEPWLMGYDVPMNTAPKTKGIKIPVLGYIKAGLPITAVDDIIDYEEIPETLAKRGEFFALQVRGDSMSPTIEDGDIAIFKVQPVLENGEIGAVIFNGDNEATLKRVYTDETGITLVPDNPNNSDGYKPTHYSNKEIEDIPITIAGKLMEVRKKFY